MSETKYLAVHVSGESLYVININGNDVSALTTREMAQDRVLLLPTGERSEIYGCLPIAELEDLERRAAKQAHTLTPLDLAPATTERWQQFDPEIDAMCALVQALGPLDEAARNRVLAWAQDRFVKPPSLVELASRVRITEEML